MYTLYIYIHTYTYIQIYTNIYNDTLMYIPIHSHIHLHIYIYMCIRVTSAGPLMTQLRFTTRTTLTRVHTTHGNMCNGLQA